MPDSISFLTVFLAEHLHFFKSVPKNNHAIDRRYISFDNNQDFHFKQFCTKIQSMFKDVETLVIQPLSVARAGFSCAGSRLIKGIQTPHIPNNVF